MITVTGTGRSTAAAGHLVVEVGRHAKFDRRARPPRQSACYADNVEVIVGDGAELTFVSIQDWDDDAVHLGTHEAGSAATRHYRHVLVTFGGDLVRVNANVDYAGPGGEAELLGLYFADAGQHLEHRLFVDHNAAAHQEQRRSTRARCKATAPTRSGSATC